MEKKKIIAKKRPYVAELEERLDNAETILQATEEQAAIAELSARDVAARAVNDYKRSTNFE